MLEKLVNGFESFLFRNRAWVVGIFVFLTLFLGFQASQLKMDAAFIKNIPLHHSYMQTYLKHQKILVAPTASWWRWKTPAAIFLMRTILIP